MHHPPRRHSIIPAAHRQRARRTFAISIASWLLFTAAVAAAPPGPGPQVGTNLGFLTYYGGEWPFVDVFKTSSRWYRSGPCGWDCGALALDSNGWVSALDWQNGEMATTFVFTDSAGTLPHGPGDDDEYVVLYDGVGLLDYDGAEILSRQVMSGPGGPRGRDVVELDAASAELSITVVLTGRSTWDPAEATDPAAYVRNIRVIVPGFESSYDTQIFHPRFLQNLASFDVVRLMDWMDTINSDVVSYDDYPKASSARWSPAPAAIMAELANRLGADLWINVPHLADDDFLFAQDPLSQEVSGLAADLAATLDVSRKLYVEYGNEIWNPEFDAYLEVADLGCHALPGMFDACNDDLDPNNATPCEGHPDDPVPACDTARVQYTSHRSLELWQDVADAFDHHLEDSSASRLVRVLSSRTGDSALHDALLSHEDAYQSTDALAVNGYFGWSLGGDPVVQGWDLSDPADKAALIARLTQEVDDTLWDLEADRLFLLGSPSYSSIPLVLYEGGQGLVAWGPNQGSAHVDQLFDQANRDQLMGDRYQQLLDGWLARGGGVLFNHYVNCRSYDEWGRYGALEHQRQDPLTSEKYSALMDFIASLP